jgi:Flp pilus assembly protein TadG
MDDEQPEMTRPLLATAGRFFGPLRRDARGGMLVILAFALPLVAGALGLGVEGANWYQTQ